MPGECSEIHFASSVFCQLQRFRKEHGNEAAALYNNILDCLQGRLDCPETAARGGKIRLRIGRYRVIAAMKGERCDVLRIYRSLV